MPRSGHAHSDYLFRDSDFLANQDMWQKKLRKSIETADASAIRAGTVEEAAERFVSEFRLEVPELTEGAISVDLEEAQVEVTGDFHYGEFGPGPHYVAGIRASYFVPFRGDPQLFRLKPSRWSPVTPAAAIEQNELRFTFERPGQPVEETKKAFEAEFGRVKQYLGWLREDATTYNESLLPVAREGVNARRGRLAELDKGTSALGIPVRSATGSVPPATPSRTAPKAPAPVPEVRRYDVALSFAGEDRVYVDEVANGLKAAGVEVFYDAFEKASLWGKNLVEHLAGIYQERSTYVVMFISTHYVTKAWPSHERRHAQARALLAKQEYILPARFDDTEVPGMTKTVGHVDLRKTTPQEFVDLILTKLGR